MTDLKTACIEGCRDGWFTSAINGNVRRCPACNSRPGSGGGDPKGPQGAAKVPFAAVPWAVIAEAAVGMGEGATKYGAHNWRTSGGVEAMTYIAGAMRHLVAYATGEDVDAASGLPHVVKAVSSLMVLRDAQINGVCLDNRPPAVPPGFMDALNMLWGDVRDRAEVERERIASTRAPSPRPAPHEVLRAGKGRRH